MYNFQSIFFRNILLSLFSIFDQVYAVFITKYFKLYQVVIIPVMFNLY